MTNGGVSHASSHIAMQPIMADVRLGVATDVLLGCGKQGLDLLLINPGSDEVRPVSTRLYE